MVSIEDKLLEEASSKEIKTVEELKLKSKDPIDYKVPQKRKVTLATAFGIIASSFFLTLFITSLFSFIAQIQGYIMTAFFIFGWDPLITTLFMSLFFLFIGVTLLIASKRSTQAFSRVETGLNMMIKNPPLQFYDLSEVPTENLIHEFVGKNNPRSKDRGRGCKLVSHENGSGFNITCDHIPQTKAIETLKNGTLGKYEARRGFIIIVIFSIIGVLFGTVTGFGLLSGFTAFLVWGIYLFALFFTLLELKIIKAWGIVIGWFLINLSFIFMPVDGTFFWTMWGVWITFTIIIAIFYMLKTDACIKKYSWVCEYL